VTIPPVEGGSSWARTAGADVEVRRRTARRIRRKKTVRVRVKK
jgi:hypothetical protein